MKIKLLILIINYLENKKYTEGDVLTQGDDVIVCGKVVNFRGNTPETVQGSAYLYSLNGKTKVGGGNDTPSSDLGTKDAPLTVAKALDAINALADVLRKSTVWFFWWE